MKIHIFVEAFKGEEEGLEAVKEVLIDMGTPGGLADDLPTYLKEHGYDSDKVDTFDIKEGKVMGHMYPWDEE